MEENVADLQAQIVALRIAVESAWLSLLTPSPDPIGDAQRLGAEHVVAIRQMDTGTANARALQDIVVQHTEQLWGSIAWQLANAKGNAPPPTA